MTHIYFLCGIGGSGMSALVPLLRAHGHTVYGSDRSYDRGETPEKYALLQEMGVKMFQQDGSGLSGDVDILVVSSAIEDRIPDVRAAKDRNIPIRKRAEILADMFNSGRGVAIAGTSGKTTTTAMIGHVLRQAGLDPSIVNGGIMVNLEEDGIVPGNAVSGTGDIFVTETDESDGSIALFHPAVAVLNNIALDHKPLEELKGLFTAYLESATQAVILNADNDEVMALSPHCKVRAVTYGIENEKADIRAQNLDMAPDGAAFNVRDGRTGQQVAVRLQVPGRHNVSNALAAIAAAYVLDVPLDKAAQALAGFKGTRRRMEIVGRARDITVIDDFAHNPDKIAATLQTLRQFEGRILAIWQPHGFGPTRMLKDELIQSFAMGLGKEDMLLLPEIYYAGGTAERTISSNDIVKGVNDNGRTARFFDTRPEIVNFLRNQARPGDRIIVMGARDDTLTDFARDILNAVAGR